MQASLSGLSVLMAQSYLVQRTETPDHQFICWSLQLWHISPPPSEIYPLSQTLFSFAALQVLLPAFQVLLPAFQVQAKLLHKTGGLNRKGDDTASNPASCSTLTLPSTKLSGASTPKATSHLAWSSVTSSIQTSKSELHPPRSEASVKAIYFIPTISAFQPLENT